MWPKQSTATLTVILRAPPPSPQLQDKFRLDIDDEAADSVFLKLVDESVAAFFPAFFELVHRVRVAMR